MRKFWPFSFFFLMFAAVAAHMPFLVLYYQDLGFSGGQIGLLTAISPLVTMVTVPLWTGTADKTNHHRLIMSASLLVAMVGVAIIPFLTSFTTIFAAILLISIFFAPVVSFANSATMYMLGDEKDLYGRLRVGGTIGFGFATMIASTLVEHRGIPVAFWLSAGFIFLTFLVGLRLEFGAEEPRSAAESKGEMRFFLRDLNWIFLLSFAFIAGAAMSALNNYFYPYMKELGAGQSTMGIAMTLGTIAEVPVMFFADRFILRFRAYGTLILSLAMTGIRLVLFGLVDDPLAAMVIQLTNGLTIPLFIVAGVAIADQYSPKQLRTTGQGLFNSAMMGVGVAAGSFAGGVLLIQSGAQSLYLMYGLATLVVLLVVLILRSRLLGQPLLSSS